MASNRMYTKAKSWSPFKGCSFSCRYCRPSFAQQAKRQGSNCRACYHYIPHYHPERLDKIPSSDIVFVCASGDISFCMPLFTRMILDAIQKDIDNPRKKKKIYYLQSKDPAYFEQFEGEFPQRVHLVTTLETNRDEGYRFVSTAPPPTRRFKAFKRLKHPSKVVTVEPLLDCEPYVLASWITELEPDHVWLGLNSRPGRVRKLPEPEPDKLRILHELLIKNELDVRLKETHGIL